MQAPCLAVAITITVLNTSEASGRVCSIVAVAVETDEMSTSTKMKMIVFALNKYVIYELFALVKSLVRSVK